MIFPVLLHPKASYFLKKTNETLRNRLKEKIKALSKFPESGERLSVSNFWRLRIGDYRVIYEIDKKEKQVIILFIGHRNKVYDDFSRIF